MRTEALLGDITTQEVDAVVNAANSSLMGGGGVDGAIHRAAGPGLLEECMELRRTELPDGLPVGRSVPTAGHRLPARWIIHTVGPNAHRGETDPGLLSSCFTTALEVADELQVRTVAFPAISAGIYGWDAEDVARTAVAAVRSFAERRADDACRDATGTSDEAPGAGIELVRFVLFDDRLLDAFQRALGKE